MALAWCAVRRSASKFASLCGGRVRIISTVVDRPSLALNPSPLRPFVSSSFYYPAVFDQLSSEQMLIREIDSEINLASQNSDMFKDEETTPESSPFRIEDDGGETVTLTRDYKGEHIKVVVGVPSDATMNEEGTLDYYEYGVKIPLTVNITKKSGLSLEFRCKFIDEYDWIHIDGVFGDHSVDSLKDQLANGEGTYFKDLDYKLQLAFYKYLKTRLTKGTMFFVYKYMTTNKRRHFLWLKDVKKFLDDES